MIADKILTLNDVKTLNAETAPIVVLHSTKGQNADIIKQLNKNVSIQILGGYSDPVYKNTKYENRTFYTPAQVSAIISAFNQIEKGIKDNWTDLEKAYFMYCTITLYLNYDYQNSIQKDAENSKIFKLFIDNPHLSQAHLDFGQKLLQKCNKIDDVPIIYRNLCTIFTRKSHCSGFANCLKEGLDRLGIKNKICHIYNTHTFNIINIDNKYLIADPTFERNILDETKTKNINNLGMQFGKYNSTYSYFKHYFPYHDLESQNKDTNQFIILSSTNLKKLQHKILPEVFTTLQTIKIPKYQIERPIKIQPNLEKNK